MKRGRRAMVGGPAPAAVFGLTAVPDATVNITQNLSAANWVHADWWPWTVRTVRFERTGVLSIIIVHHSGGGRVYDQVAVGSFAFSEAGANYGSPSFSATVVGYHNLDLNHDGYGDLACWNQANGDNNLIYSNATGNLTATVVPWNFDSANFAAVREQQPSGHLQIETRAYPQWPTTLNYTRYLYSWNGSAYVETSGTIDPVTEFNLPAGTVTSMQSYLDNGSQDPTKRFMEFRYVPFDFDLDGTNDDLIIQLIGGYGGVLRGWYLESDGAGGYIDRTSTWNLPTTGLPMIARQKEFGRPFEPTQHPDADLHDLAGAAKPDLFLEDIPVANGGGGQHGHYRWNAGLGQYEKLTGSPITARLGENDAYPKRLYAVDLTNSGRLDYVLQRPRSAVTYVYTHDGSGTLALHSTRTSWDADGLCIDDVDGDGLPDFVLGGDGGADSGVASGDRARCLSIYENTTTSPGNYLGILIRRTGREATNYFGVGAKVEVFTAGQSFAASALVRRWYARPDGLPLVFGVGRRGTVDYRVTWPDGTTTTQTAVATNQTVTVTG